MVLVERVSLVIRPLTLSIRLAANIVAGHLMIALSGGGCRVSIVGPARVGSQTALSLLESAVAGVQAYVFIVLLSLYRAEASHYRPTGLHQE